MLQNAGTSPRSFAASTALIALTLVLGLAIRFGPLGLPWAIRKYGGSVLWAAMLYWVASTLLGRMRLPAVALITESGAVAVEFFKLVHTPGLERFRATLPGILLLGREFSYTDILAYTIAILCAFFLDSALRSRRSRLSVER
ncbi:ribosomal maturation YjgA family protein [Terriglobus aquaticus]|uniref:DUF2809 domain-containing protein n=1 Tax=Terriglobus aquaticus TaxID=940139 RepID=A0ABW9KHV7_9BACT|nr:DUF2809 domain-containing protein [Terriglobus aquaticus]